MAHWMDVLWAVNALIGVATWRNATLAIVRLILALTNDPDRAARCAEILRLARKDAKDLSSYLALPLAPTAHTPAKRRARNRRAQNKDIPQVTVPLLPSAPESGQPARVQFRGR